MLERLIGLLLSAGGPTFLMDRSPWPLHQALGRAARSPAGDYFRAWGIDLQFRQQDEVGLAVVGVAAGLFALIGKGVLIPRGTGVDARLEVDIDALRPYRKALMALDPLPAELLHEVAVTWAAYACAAEKTWARALASRGAISTGCTPNRRHVEAEVAF